MDSNHLFGRIRQCGMCCRSYCLCQGCDRGHWYCSEFCSARARQESQKRAAIRYRQTEVGRQNHAAAQRRYRKNKRQQKISEIYHSSAAAEVSLNPSSPPSAEEVSRDDKIPLTAKVDVIRCHMCKAVVRGFVEGRRYPRRRVQPHKLRTDFYDFSRNTS